jgi:aryl-alcohol dehydrogenase-like predicted oxidoreductase
VEEVREIARINKKKMSRHLSLPPRRLGRAGFTVRPFGLGGATIGSDRVSDETAVETVRRALELGIEFIDTSVGYGRGESERRIGLALTAADRRRIRLQTKAGTGTNPKEYSADGIKRSVESSLNRIKTDYLDVCLIHDPDDMQPVLAPGGGIDALLRLKEEGIIGATGLGVRRHDFLRQAIEDGRFDVILTYLDYTLLSRTAAPLICEADAAGLGVVIGSPLATGLLAGGDGLPCRYGRPSDPDDPPVRTALQMRSWAAERRVSLPALALQWVLLNPHVGMVLAGAASPTEVEENVSAITMSLPTGIWEEWERADWAFERPEF